MQFQIRDGSPTSVMRSCAYQEESAPVIYGPARRQMSEVSLIYTARYGKGS